tara:strand:+ start:46703 stop:47155 length:453 start_codon:yes stop_codon:yes gene_type:complete
MLFAATADAAEEFTSGYGALDVFDGQAFVGLPLAVKSWLVFMLLTFAAGLLFARKHPIARWATGGIVVSMLTGHAVFQALGLPMLSGSIAICHVVCWTPALVLLLIKRPFFDRDEGRWFRIWSAVMTCVILISFVFDIRDAAIYIRHFSE